MAPRGSPRSTGAISSRSRRCRRSSGRRSAPPSTAPAYSTMCHTTFGRRPGSFTVSMPGAARRSSTTWGRYIFRVAIANSALERIQNGQVTFRYRDNRIPTPSPGDALRRRVSPTLPPARAPARVYEGALLRDLESHLPWPTRSGPSASDRPAIGFHRAGAHHANAATGRHRSSADALSSVWNGNLDLRGRPRAATDACAMTGSSPDVTRPVRARVAAWLRRRLPSPTGRARGRRMPIEIGVHSREAAHPRPHAQTTDLLASCLRTTRSRSLKLQIATAVPRI
jgi:hypothetical protein